MNLHTTITRRELHNLITEARRTAGVTRRALMTYTPDALVALQAVSPDGKTVGTYANTEVAQTTEAEMDDTYSLEVDIVELFDAVSRGNKADQVSIHYDASLPSTLTVDDQGYERPVSFWYRSDNDMPSWCAKHWQRNSSLHMSIWHINAKAFHDALASVSLAILKDKSDPRTFLKGVQLILADKTVTMTATDGHRLARTTIEAGPAQPERTIALRRLAIDQLQRLTRKSRQGVISLACHTDSDVAVVSVDDNLIETRVLDDDRYYAPRIYDHAARMLNVHAPYTVTVQLDTFAERFKPVLQAAKRRNNKFPIVRVTANRQGLSFDPVDGTTQAFDAHGVTDGVSTVKLGVNAQYVADLAAMIKAAGAHRMTWHLSGERDAIKVTGDCVAEYLLMPCRL